MLTDATDDLKPQHATAPLPLHRLFPIHKWKPRSGRNLDYFKWRRDIVLLAGAFGLDECDL